MERQRVSLRKVSVGIGVALLAIIVMLVVPRSRPTVFAQGGDGTPAPPVFAPYVVHQPTPPTPTATRTRPPLTPLPSPATATPTNTPTNTSTNTPTGTPPTATPTNTPGTPVATSGEWTQFGFSAQRTSYQPQEVAVPWRWAWSWNGPNATGGVAAGKSELPRNSQPITGGGRVYVAAGDRGVFALNAATGAVLWGGTPGGSINSTPAYDTATGALFVVSSNGRLYKLNAATGSTLGEVSTGATSDLPLPPALVGNRVYFSMGNRIYAVNAATLNVDWSYDAGSPVDTPPAYSATANTVVALSRDLYVHAVNATNGVQRWRVKPTNRTPSSEFALAGDRADVRNGWPVIAETHGLVFIRYRLDWNTLWTWSPWPSSNSQMRANLAGRLDQQTIFALRLDTGAVSFVPNVGNGGFGDGNYLPMGPLPVVKQFADGSELAYVVMRGTPCLNPSFCDGRWDARMGELMLDGATVAGYQAGDVRFMQNTFFPTDEMAFLSMAGNQIYGGHWEAGIAHQIVNRGPSVGTSNSPITTSNLPHIATSQDQDICGTGFRTSHYCASGLRNTRTWPGGFYVYWNQGTVFDQYWSGYSSWVISAGLVLYVATEGSVTALTAGTPVAASADDSLAGVTGAAEAIPSAVQDLAVIPATDARAYAGRNVVVQGVLAEVFSNGKAVYLGFHKPHQGHFLVRILRADWANFAAPPETLFAPGDAVQVTGKIEWYQGDPVIVARTPDQIVSAESTARDAQGDAAIP